MKPAVARIGLLLFFFVFVSVNIASSLQYPELLTDLLDSKVFATTIFLKKIRYHRSFDGQFSIALDKFGISLSEAVFQDERLRQDQISRLETVLSKNPQSRDVLIKLALLHLKNDNLIASRDYYQRAKQIDPWIDIDSLAKL